LVPVGGDAADVAHRARPGRRGVGRRARRLRGAGDHRRADVHRPAPVVPRLVGHELLAAGHRDRRSDLAGGTRTSGPGSVTTEEGLADEAGVATASGTVAAWTLVSRATGFVRVAVVAAVLGATYL